MVHTVHDISSSSAAVPVALRSVALPRPSALRAVLILHGFLASFVAFHAYPVTQDGPAHLYGAQILRGLTSSDAAIYRGYFSANLHPAGNSLFSYLALGVTRYAPAEWAVSIALFLALIGMPLSLLAFARALHGDGTPHAGRQTFEPGIALSCVLAYNYFTYRGLLNYSLSVPCAFASLAAVIAVGQARLSPLRISALTGLALTFATLAALAHPAAVMFLLVAIVCACLSRGSVRRAVGAGVVMLLLAFTLTSHIKSDAPTHVGFMSPLMALQAFVRALGITQTWLEVVPAVLILALALRAARQGFPSLRRLPTEWRQSWPVLFAVAMGLGYFVLPFEYGGLAGVNERVPLFAVLLLLPYVRVSPRALRWAPLGFCAFALYTVVERVHLDGLAQEVRNSTAVNAIPRGTPVYAVSLRVKLGALSADLGRHLIADVARRRDLVAGTVFCSHPAHVLKCTDATPAVGDEGAVQSFEHLNEGAQRAALADPESAIRKSFLVMREQARSSKYLLVIGAASLNAAFDRYVTSPIGARLLSPETDALRVYEVVKVSQQ